LSVHKVQILDQPQEQAHFSRSNQTRSTKI